MHRPRPTPCVSRIVTCCRIANNSGCYPFSDRDPFMMNQCPHVYFLGNQEEFGTRLVTGINNQQVRLVTLPRFSRTGSIALLNLRTLEVEEVNFNAGDSPNL